MPKRLVVLWLLAALTLASGSCTTVRPTPSLQPTAVPTVTSVVAVTNGVVRDAITQAPVAGAKLESGAVSTLSDAQGAFSVVTLTEAEIQVTASGYESLRFKARAAFPLIVDLVPDAATTFRIILDYEKQHEFGREYDLLHPDIQAQFSREDFVRYMELYRPYDVVSFAVVSTSQAVSGSVLGKPYDHVAQVAAQVTVRMGEQVSQRLWSGYASQVDGQWRWLRGPLVWPTPIPTATSTQTPTPTATSTTTRTATPTITVFPTAYAPFLPGSQVLLVQATVLRTGPGDSFPANWGVAYGTVLSVLNWPSWVSGLPWYPVQVRGSEHTGWVDGGSLTLLAVPATPTSSAPTPSATPTISTLTPTPSATVTLPTPMVGLIAFTSDRDGNREIYVMDTNGANLRNLTRHTAQDSDPSWSLVHNRLAFVSDRAGNSDIYVMNADGSDVVQLTSQTSEQLHPVWSPNGSWIAYVSNEDGNWEIFVMASNGLGSTQLTHTNAWNSYPAWSPDSHKVAFVSDRSGNYDLYVYDLMAQTETRLTDNPASDAFPAWSPTGNEIAFTSARDGPLELYLLDWATIPNRVTRLTYTLPLSAANRYPCWSADGAWLAFTSWRDGNAEIYLMQRNGGKMRNLTNHPAADESPAWAH